MYNLNSYKFGESFKKARKIKGISVSKIAKEINKHGVALSAGKITQVVDACISSYSSPFEDMDEGDEDPGVHWVNGYDRSDGTHVDGYYRHRPNNYL